MLAIALLILSYAAPELVASVEIKSFMSFLKKASSAKNLNITRQMTKYLTSLKPEQLNALSKQLEKTINTIEFAKVRQELMKFTKNNPINNIKQAQIKEIHNRIAKNKQKIVEKSLNKTLITLSSSWLSYGIWTFGYESASDSYGVLEWGTKTGQGPYLTPNISLSTWNDMVAAKGSDGTGAGSVGWKQGVFKGKGRSIVRAWNNWRKKTKQNDNVIKYY